MALNEMFNLFMPIFLICEMEAPNHPYFKGAVNVKMLILVRPMGHVWAHSTWHTVITQLKLVTVAVVATISIP